MKIALIDDENDIREIVTLALETSDFEVVSTGSSAEAIDLIRGSDPDLVLLDHELGEIRGSELLARLRADPELRDIPVVFLTGHTDRGFQRTLTDAGAAGVISKPFDPFDLVDRVEGYLSGNQPSDAPDRPDESCILDESVVESLRALESSRPGFVQWLVDELESDCVRRIEKMRDAVGTDRIVVADEAHALKSSAGNLGAMRLSACARELERLARDHSEPLPRLIDRVEEQFEEARVALTDYCRRSQ